MKPTVHDLDASVKRDIDRFARFLKTKGLRLTTQREIIARKVFSHTEHFDAESLCQDVRGEDRSVSRATVYRTINLLVESGMVEEQDFGKGYKTYEQVTSQPHHEHLVCTVTGKVIEFEDEELNKLLQRVALRHNFQMTGHSLRIFGVCAEARQQGSHQAG